jgi:hypothetical protein
MQLDSPPLVVSPLWVEASIKADRRQVEKKYAVVKPPPQPTAIAIHPADAPPKRKQRATTAAARAAQPKPSAAYDVDTSDIMFNSSQLIRGGGGAAGKRTRSTRNNGVVDPDEVNSIKKVAKNNNNNNNNGKRRRGAAAHEDDSQQRSLPALPGRSTQQVADILCIDLPVGDDRNMDGGDDLDTPLSVRVAKKKKEELIEEKNGDGEMEEEEEEEEEPQPNKETAARAAPANNNNRKQKKPKPPLAMRFSVRQLRVYPERPVLLHKGTPLPGCEPPQTIVKATAGAKKGGSGIPIPPIEMVSSPWADAEQLPLTQDTPQPSNYKKYQQQQQTAPPSTQPAPTFLEGKKPTPFTAPRPWDNGPVGPLGGGGGGGRRRAVGVKSRYGQEADRQQHNNNNNNNNQQQENMDPSPIHIPPPGPGTAVKKTPVDIAGMQLEQQQQRVVTEVVTEVGTAATTAGGDINSNSGARRTAGGSSISVCRRATVSTRSNSDGSSLLAKQLTTTTPRATGVVAMTSVDQPLNDICASACRRLRGMRLCPDGKEDGQITHLVVGQERRTLKVMLAIANGAWLVSPEWITASLEAGRWLPESQFSAKVRFAAAADKARAALEVPDDNLLLEGRRLHITAGGSGKAASVNANALRRVALALGAKVVAAKSCTMAVVMGTSRRPEGLGKDVPAVREEWLLQAAERYELPCINTFKL